ncbi:uncharacterized protein [Rutidosis leptorrhynchoides]|uniref:uncharacterized protein n=1 Tax=Rutidosis leptorrhynchoides TaxID=125765 RepID=UPI003A99DA72
MANKSYNFIEDLDTIKDSWKLKVKLLSVWKTYYNVEMIVMDEKSDKIHATVKHGLMHNFESVLEEGVVVMLSKFIVGDNKKLKYPMTQHKYKLTFLRGTNIRRCLSWNGPVNGSNFFPFSEISLHGQDEHLPVDIIGVVQHCTDLDVYNKTKDGSEGGEIGKKMTLDVQDENGVIEKLQLWDDYAQKFHDYVSATKREGTMILLQFGRIRLWVEKGTLSFQNAKFGTKMWIDDNDVPEIVEFRATFNSKIANASSSQGGSVLSSQVTHSGVSDFLNPKLKKTIEDIVGSTEPMICVVLAEIKSFQKEHGWNYIGCRKCKKKVLKKSEMVNNI